jgi:hypothetical protein
MSIILNDILIDSNLYSQTEWDEIYNTLMQSLFNDTVTNKSIMTELTYEGQEEMERGDDFFCTFVELWLYQLLVEYMILMRKELDRTTTADEYNDVIDKYKISEVRKGWICKYGKYGRGYSIIDKMLELVKVKLNRTELSGIDYMSITCDFQYGPELQTNGKFDSGAGWFNNSGGIYSPVSISSGDHNISSLTPSNIYTNTILTNGITYQLDFDLVSGTNLNVYSGSTGIETYTDPGSYSKMFISQGTRIGFISDGISNPVIDNVVIREVLSTSSCDGTLIIQ